LLDNYTINKIILSREVTLKEIEQILTEFPNVTFEVFGEGDFCRYNNGLCFAEHKYTTRDICTVVVNDLIIKKRYHPDFKKIILDETLLNIEKIDKLSTTYQDIFEEIEDILEKITL
jgi:collagenase-like PrtC family protease